MEEVNIILECVEAVIRTTKGPSITVTVPTRGTRDILYSVVKEVYGLNEGDLQQIKFVDIKDISISIPAWKFISDSLYVKNEKWYNGNERGENYNEKI